MTVKEAYQNCYRLVRLQQQCMALRDFESEGEIFAELIQYPVHVHRAANQSWEARWMLFTHSDDLFRGRVWAAIDEWVRRTKSVWNCPLCGNTHDDDCSDLPLPIPEGVF